MALYDVDRITFSYPRSPRPVLRDVSLKIEEGETVALLGRNGSGKSTLMSCMLGLNTVDSGTILLDGTPLAMHRKQDIARIVGFVPQLHTPEFAYSVLDFVVMGCAAGMGLFERPGPKEFELAYEALGTLGIEGIAEVPYTEVSGGQRQQATIARAIVAKPRMVIFDEPTAHLDLTNQIRVLRILRRLSDEGFAVMFSTHDPDQAFLMGGTSALLEADGTLVSGRTEDVLTDERLREVYGPDIRVEFVESLGRRTCLYPAI